MFQSALYVHVACMYATLRLVRTFMRKSGVMNTCARHHSSWIKCTRRVYVFSIRMQYVFCVNVCITGTMFSIRMHYNVLYLPMWYIIVHINEPCCGYIHIYCHVYMHINALYTQTHTHTYICTWIRALLSDEHIHAYCHVSMCVHIYIYIYAYII